MALSGTLVVGSNEFFGSNDFIFNSQKPPPTRTTSISDLLDVIQKGVRGLTISLSEKGVSTHDTAKLLPLIKDERIQIQRRDLLCATQSLHDLLLGPEGILESIHANDVVCMQAVHRYQIAEHVPAQSIISFERLSTLCGLNVVDLKRILRLLMTKSIFCEPQVGMVAHTDTSRLLVDNPQARDFSGIICDERFPSSAQTVNVLQKFGQSREQSQSGFSVANNTPRGLYEELARFPDRQARWTSAMSAMATRISISFLLRYFPLEPHSTGTVVDVGGGSGTVSIGLAPYFPKVHFVVEDMPSVISSSKIPVGLQGHLDFEEYDMFNPQPIQGANVYYFRNIFHNWPDEACIKILRNHAVAMRPGSKLVIDDFTLHEPLSLNPWDERRRRNMDITMLIYFGSRERTIDEWKGLLKEADARFELVVIGTAENEPNTIFVVEWRD